MPPLLFELCYSNPTSLHRLLSNLVHKAKKRICTPRGVDLMRTCLRQVELGNVELLAKTSPKIVPSQMDAVGAIARPLLAPILPPDRTRFYSRGCTPFGGFC
jgi:hypothetical protein